jgi:predicted nucleotidyltransferase
MKNHNVQTYIQKATDRTLEVIAGVFGEDLLMAALYGSAATGTYSKEYSDINMLFIVKHLDPSQLEQAGKAGRKVFNTYRVTPLILSRKELEDSEDVFPVEYLEIRDTMKLLYGENLFDQLNVGRQNIRHQVETMVRGSLNALRQISLLFSGDRKGLRKELALWAGRQPPLFKALLRLSDEQPEDQDMVERVEKLLGFSSLGLSEIPKLREEEELSVPIEQLVLKLLSDMSTIAEAVNAHQSS